MEKFIVGGKDSHIDYRCWFVIKDLRILYAPHLYSSEADYKESEAVDKPEVVDDSDPEPSVLVEPEVIDEPDLQVDEAELEPEVE